MAFSAYLTAPMPTPPNPTDLVAFLRKEAADWQKMREEIVKTNEVLKLSESTAQIDERIVMFETAATLLAHLPNPS